MGNIYVGKALSSSSPVFTNSSQVFFGLDHFLLVHMTAPQSCSYKNKKNLKSFTEFIFHFLYCMFSCCELK
jgi:L-fucose isomerase-like protein